MKTYAIESDQPFAIIVQNEKSENYVLGQLHLRASSQPDEKELSSFALVVRSDQFNTEALIRLSREDAKIVVETWGAWLSEAEGAGLV